MINLLFSPIRREKAYAIAALLVRILTYAEDSSQFLCGIALKNQGEIEDFPQAVSSS